ncbi:MAG: hypothetical protein KatS3mg002_0516 [Candidatus Woesearchaeota archaeon]|nr:MAG: hypothetical protein KatS3mg002_0516 [Candidatus Woesearchaeota archaeon]
MEKGLHGLHVALRIGNYYYSPAQFAIAWIATKKKSELEHLLSEVHLKIKQKEKEITEKRTPLLANLLKNNSPKEAIKDLEDIAKKSYGSLKIIRNDGAIFTDSEFSNTQSKNQYDDVRMTLRENFFAIVDTRGRRTAKNPAYKVSLFNVLGYSLTDIISNFEFKGGTPHSFYMSDELSYWSKGIEREKKHITNIEKNFGHEALADYNLHVDIVDSAVAQVLIKLDNMLKKENTNSDSKSLNNILENNIFKKDIAGIGDSKKELTSLLPFDFNRAPDLAFEAFLRVNKNKSSETGLKSLSNKEKKYFSTDIMLINYFEEFTRKEYIELRRKGLASIEVFISGKYFPKKEFSWAVIQALENHMLRKERIFSGYTLEKIGNEYFIGICFRNKDKKERQTSIRILYNDLFYPVVLYKTVTHDDLPMGTALHPMKLLNFSKPRNKYDVIWRDIDIKSGRKTINELFEPLPDIMLEAGEILLENKVNFINGKFFKTPESIKNYILSSYIEKRKSYENSTNDKNYIKDA